MDYATTFLPWNKRISLNTEAIYVDVEPIESKEQRMGDLRGIWVMWMHACIKKIAFTLELTLTLEKKLKKNNLDDGTNKIDF